MKQINKCRLCNNERLISVVELGDQSYTGTFPASREEAVPSGPLTLLKCFGDNACGLLQLAHTFDLDVLYGENYGYRSSLNSSMVKHLQDNITKLRRYTQLDTNDVIIDVGSNDGTTLKAYPEGQYRLIGIDPTAEKFKSFYPEHIECIPEFFNNASLDTLLGAQKVKVFTSFSMFYDLEDPLSFAETVAHYLADDGVWVLEQSYMPTMLEKNAFDTICHEHLEYYGLAQIDWITSRVGLKIVDVEFNDTNGGSFIVFVKKQSDAQPCQEIVYETLQAEAAFAELTPYEDFFSRIKQIKETTLKLFDDRARNGKTTLGLGASTKGNVLLQYCGLSTEQLPAIGEVNQDKIGKFTPGTQIPIISEQEVLKQKPDGLYILPWHFKSFFEESTRFANYEKIYAIAT